MTWIIGVPSIAASFIMGDRKVSALVDSQHTPVHTYSVQKVHQLAPDLTVGFAGNIRQGFRALDFMRQDLPTRSTRDWSDTDEFLRLFMDKSEALYSRFRRLTLVVVATRDIGMPPKDGDRGFALTEGKAYVLRFTESSAHMREVLSDTRSQPEAFATAGTGSSIDVWRAAVARMTSDPNFMSTTYSAARVLGDASIGTRFGSFLENAMRTALPAGDEALARTTVGSELDILVMTDSGVTHTTNQPHHTPIATSSEDFERLASRQSDDASEIYG